jgi:putative hemolysin
MLSDLLVLLALLILHGFLAGSEIAVVSLRKTRLQQLVELGRPAAHAIESLRKNPERFLATVQVFITVLGTIIASRGAPTIEELVRPTFEALGLPTGYGQKIAFAVAIAVISFGELVIGELVPKSMALRASEPYALLVSRPLLLLSSVARPAVWLLEESSNLFLRVFGDKTSFLESRLSPDELTQLLEEAGRIGSLDVRCSDIAVRAIELETLTAADVMVPRNRVISVARESAPNDVVAAMLRHGHQRLPVHDDDPDDIVGYLAAKDVLTTLASGSVVSVDDLIRPATFFPETMKVTHLLKEMQTARLQMSIIVDERGSMAGVVTMEDLLEELVGEIWSEDDRGVPSPIRTTRDGSAIVVGTTPLREVNRTLDLALPEGDLWTTIAGYTIALAGRIPEPGERLLCQDGSMLEILESTPRRVRTIRVIPQKQPVST